MSSDFLTTHWKLATVVVVGAIGTALGVVTWLFPESRLTLTLLHGIDSKSGNAKMQSMTRQSSSRAAAQACSGGR